MSDSAPPPVNMTQSAPVEALRIRCSRTAGKTKKLALRTGETRAREEIEAGCLQPALFVTTYAPGREPSTFVALGKKPLGVLIYPATVSLPILFTTSSRALEAPCT